MVSIAPMESAEPRGSEFKSLADKTVPVKNPKSFVQDISWTVWLSLIWLSGAVLILGRLLLGTLNAQRIIRRSIKVTDETWLAHLRALSIQIGLSSDVLLSRSDRLSMPLTTGTFRSAILIPAEADEWTSERREVVLLHELAHVKRRDCLMQFIAQLTSAVYWFNPLVWVVTRRLRIERERACDDHVLGLGTRASDYASHLLEIARSMGSAKCPTLAAVAMAKPSQLEGRLLAILDPKLNRRGFSRTSISILALVIAAVMVPLAAIQPLAKTVKSDERQTPRRIADSAAPIQLDGSSQQNGDTLKNRAGEQVESSRLMGKGIAPTPDNSQIDIGQNGPMPAPTPMPTPTPAPMPMPMPAPMPIGGDRDWSARHGS